MSTAYRSSDVSMMILAAVDKETASLLAENERLRELLRSTLNDLEIDSIQAISRYHEPDNPIMRDIRAALAVPDSKG
jgi:hypothetical protein